MRKYCGTLDNAAIPPETLDLVSRTTSKYEVGEKIIDIRKVDANFWLRVRWDGLPEPRNYTWSALGQLYEDIPDMVRDYPRMTTKKRLATAGASCHSIVL